MDASIIDQARRIVADEEFSRRVGEEVARIRKEKRESRWWHKFVPFKIIITRR